MKERERVEEVTRTHPSLLVPAVSAKHTDPAKEPEAPGTPLTDIDEGES